MHCPLFAHLEHTGKSEADFESAPARIDRLTRRTDEALRAKGIATRPEDVQSELDETIAIIRGLTMDKFTDEAAWNNGLKDVINQVQPEKVTAGTAL